MPWTLLLPAALRELRAGPGSSLQRLALCGALAPLLWLSLCGGKLGSYVLPWLPPLSIALALGLAPAASRRPRGLRPGAAARAALAGLTLLLASAKLAGAPLL